MPLQTQPRPMLSPILHWPTVAVMIGLEVPVLKILFGFFPVSFLILLHLAAWVLWRIVIFPRPLPKKLPTHWIRDIVIPALFSIALPLGLLFWGIRFLHMNTSALILGTAPVLFLLERQIRQRLPISLNLASGFLITLLCLVPASLGEPFFATVRLTSGLLCLAGGWLLLPFLARAFQRNSSLNPWVYLLREVLALGAVLGVLYFFEWDLLQVPFFSKTLLFCLLYSVFCSTFCGAWASARLISAAPTAWWLPLCGVAIPIGTLALSKIWLANSLDLFTMGGIAILALGLVLAAYLKQAS